MTMKNFNRYMKPKINQKIINFFLENPSSIDTSRGIATWINENISKTEKGLRNLVEAGILVPYGEDAASAYSCTTDSHVIARVKIGLKKINSRKKKRSH